MLSTRLEAIVCVEVTVLVTAGSVVVAVEVVVTVLVLGNPYAPIAAPATAPTTNPPPTPATNFRLDIAFLFSLSDEPVDMIESAKAELSI
jgi:hypothetical protein